jgi:hypothetical protein
MVRDEDLPDGVGEKLSNLTVLLPGHLLSGAFGMVEAAVEARPSSVHGTGVFVTRDLPPRTVVTAYPPHAVVWAQHGTAKGGDACAMYSREQLSVGNQPSIHESSVYQFDIDGHFALFGNPKLTDNPAYLGHMINDGVRVTDHPLSKLFYVPASAIKRNCEYIVTDLFVVLVVTTRAIKKDEELFSTYGFEYWDNALEKEKIACE